MRVSQFLAALVAATVIGGTFTTNAYALGAGSIAFVGFNADNLDDIAFVLLEDVTPSTQIRFNDNDWNGTAFDSAESIFQWTSPSTTTVAAGTVVTLSSVGAASISANVGTTSFLNSTNLGLNGTDEVLYAYQGTEAAPTFLFAITNAANYTTLANGVLTNTGLSETANTAVRLPSSSDIGQYVGPRANPVSFANFLPSIGDEATNWVVQNAAGDQSADGTNPDVPFNATRFVIPETNTLGFLALALPVIGGVIARRRK